MGRGRAPSGRPGLGRSAAEARVCCDCVRACWSTRSRSNGPVDRKRSMRVLFFLCGPLDGQAMARVALSSGLIPSQVSSLFILCSAYVCPCATACEGVGVIFCYPLSLCSFPDSRTAASFIRRLSMFLFSLRSFSSISLDLRYGALRSSRSRGTQ